MSQTTLKGPRKAAWHRLSTKRIARQEVGTGKPERTASTIFLQGLCLTVADLGSCHMLWDIASCSTKNMIIAHLRSTWMRYSCRTQASHARLSTCCIGTVSMCQQPLASCEPCGTQADPWCIRHQTAKIKPRGLKNSHPVLGASVQSEEVWRRGIPAMPFK